MQIPVPIVPSYRSLLLCLLAGCFALPAGSTTAVEPVPMPPVLDFKQDIRPLVKRLCFDCHQGEDAEEGFDLEPFQTAKQVIEDRQIWQKVLARLRAQQMPPKKEEQPTEQQRQQLVHWIQQTLNYVDCSAGVNPGRVTIRRLNRTEYRNTVRDLLGIDYPLADGFPADDVGYGFDNMGDVLSLPLLLMEKYLTAAQEITEQAIVTQFPAPMDKLLLASKMSATRGSHADENGERILVTTSEMFLDIEFPYQGEYQFQVVAYGDQAGSEPVKMAFRIDDKNVKTVEVKNSEDDPTRYTYLAEVKAGRHRIALAFLNDYYVSDAPDPKNRDRNLIVQSLEITGPANFRPAEMPDVHRRIFIAHPGDKKNTNQAAREILRPLASRAYRRPVTDAELNRMLSLVALAERNGDNFETGIQLAVQSMLVSPHFLFKVEIPGQLDKNGDFNLDDYPLAASLSYFLWSSMPDQELSRIAHSGKLRKNDNLAKQVRRMLADPKSEALVHNFAGQWLNLRNLETITPDKKLFPAFTDKLRNDMRTETEMFFASIVNENRSLIDLLTADYSFINETLAKHYDIKGVTGDRFQRVQLAGTRRGGLLTQASILTLTSNPTRTSPVKRGKWVLENMLADPPPPPAADAPPLDDQAELTGTTRQKMEQHRADPRCATCHTKMDPIGFSLENFDAIGRWRMKDQSLPIDASGELPGGEKFDGAEELQKILSSNHREAFIRCVSEKMLTYALGRGLEYYDRCAVDKIVAALADDDFRMQTLIQEIVRSDPFQRRRVQLKQK